VLREVPKHEEKAGSYVRDEDEPDGSPSAVDFPDKKSQCDE